MQFHLISWCGNFVERQFPQLETMWKLCLSTKFLRQEIRWNYGTLQWYVDALRLFRTQNNLSYHLKPSIYMLRQFHKPKIFSFFLNKIPETIKFLFVLKLLKWMNSCVCLNQLSNYFLIILLYKNSYSIGQKKKCVCLPLPDRPC